MNVQVAIVNTRGGACYKVMIPGRKAVLLRPDKGRCTQKGALQAARWYCRKQGIERKRKKNAGPIHRAGRRSNSDEEMRRLERAAAQGDVEAQAKLKGMLSRKSPLIGRRIQLGGRDGWQLVTSGRNLGEGNTLWRPGTVTGTVFSVEPGRFFQTQESISWLTVRLDRARGRFKFAKAYLDEKTGMLMFGAKWIESNSGPIHRAKPGVATAKVPGSISGWNWYGGPAPGTRGVQTRSYGLRTAIGSYHIWPPQHRGGSYQLWFTNEKGARKTPGLWTDLGKFRSPQDAARAAKAHAAGKRKNPMLAAEAWHGKGTPLLISTDDQDRPQFIATGFSAKAKNPANYRITGPSGEVSLGDLPRAAYYVTATDSFMSGWGPSQGKSNVVVVLARSYDEAETVAQNLRDRPEMKRVNISSSKPRPRSNATFSIFDRKRSPLWYSKARPFKKKKNPLTEAETRRTFGWSAVAMDTARRARGKLKPFLAGQVAGKMDLAAAVGHPDWREKVREQRESARALVFGSRAKNPLTAQEKETLRSRSKRLRAVAHQVRTTGREPFGGPIDDLVARRVIGEYYRGRSIEAESIARHGVRSNPDPTVGEMIAAQRKRSATIAAGGKEPRTAWEIAAGVCRRCKGACRVQLGPRQVTCPTCKGAGSR